MRRRRRIDRSHVRSPDLRKARKERRHAPRDLTIRNHHPITHPPHHTRQHPRIRSNSRTHIDRRRFLLRIQKRAKQPNRLTDTQNVGRAINAISGSRNGKEPIPVHQQIASKSPHPLRTRRRNRRVVISNGKNVLHNEQDTADLIQTPLLVY